MADGEGTPHARPGLNCTIEDVRYQLYVRQKVERSMQAAAAGRVHSHEQVKKRLSKWVLIVAVLHGHRALRRALKGRA